MITIRKIHESVMTIDGNGGGCDDGDAHLRVSRKRLKKVVMMQHTPMST